MVNEKMIEPHRLWFVTGNFPPIAETNLPLGQFWSGSHKLAASHPASRIGKCEHRHILLPAAIDSHRESFFG